MTPRPLPTGDAALEHALALAREGRLQESFDALLAAAPGRRSAGSRRTAGALAFAELARIAVETGSGDLAVQAIDEALRRAPGFADLHHRRAQLLLQGQDRAGARRALEAALRINPRYVAARLELALLDARDGLLAESVSALRALEQEQRVDEPRAFERGMRSLARAEWEEAAALIRGALRVSDPAVERAVADYHALAAEGEYARALEALRDAVAAHPGYADLHCLLGTGELEAGMTDDAIDSLARALELNPDLHEARVQLARAFEAQGDIVQAGEQVALVLREDPGHPQALELHGRWRRRRISGRRGASIPRDAARREAS